MRLTIACLTALLAAVPALAQSPTEEIDKGNFILYVKDRPVGAESFGIEARSDSINGAARSFRRVASQSGETMVEKSMFFVLGRPDFQLRFYQANETFQGQTMIVEIQAAVDDTAFTISRQHKGGAGIADRIVAPPGRWYVLDSGIYTLFDLICLNLHGKSFQSRPITLLTLAAGRDTIIEAEATDLGTETIRWASRPVAARKLQFKDRETAFLAWVSPQGKMLRLTHEASGLRVERDPPEVKRRPAGPKPGG
jgi:hypothetical protein